MYNYKIKTLKRRKSWLAPSWQACLPLAILIVLIWVGAVAAQEPTSNELEALKWELKVSLDTLWVVFAGCLVFFMNAGFAMLETGFCRQKNAVSILTKNLIVFALSTVAFWIIGFGLMFGFGGDWADLNATDNGFMGFYGFLVQGADNSPATGEDYRGVFRSLNWASVPLQAKFFFQLVFAGTAATIVSGAVAERIKFVAFLVFSLLLVGICYPIAGHWIWGGGWLSQLGFWDFAGSTLVHSVGGWAALVGAILLKPRLGKYQEGESLALPGHNLAISTLGCFILWLGWFGFNPGSTMAAEPRAITHILLTTNMAAAMGGISATLTSWWYFSKPDLSVIINGILAGLVAITASCRFVNIGSAAVIGLVAGAIVIFAVDFFDRLKVDDPVGAISVHLVCGIWGTIAVALFALGPDVNISSSFILYEDGPAKGLLLGGNIAGLIQLLVQLVGILSVGIFTVAFSWLTWFSMKATVGLRVSTESELKGLDITEHGLHAYSGFYVRQDFSQEASRSLPKN
ncbi:ammonium transporter [Coleofasciculus sp. LEGE 07092]|uniref:ammonium transporter n=1 Tax=Coleofasciculus sp. LEGE 07092 TaxID=2777969 RepID=UPI002AD2D796|nr:MULTISPECIES: ammonium transporter [unclassified Coleofasciculus]